MLTGQTYEVKGFHDILDAVQNFPVGINATAWTDPHAGANYILIYNKSLKFVNYMDHSLINPNHSRSFGISFWYNPYDFERTIGINTGDLFILFQTEGLAIFFNAYYP